MSWSFLERVEAALGRPLPTSAPAGGGHIDEHDAELFSCFSPHAGAVAEPGI